MSVVLKISEVHRRFCKCHNPFLGCLHTNVELQNKTLVSHINCSKIASAASLLEGIVELTFTMMRNRRNNVSFGENFLREKVMKRLIEYCCD